MGIKNCKVCNIIMDTTFLAKEMMLGYQDAFEYMECSNCGCLQLINIPTNIAAYYPDNYYSLSSSPEIFFGNPFKAWLKKQRDYFVITAKGFVGKLIQAIMPNQSIELFNFRKLNINKQSKILDIGSGAGIIPFVFKNAGFKNIMGLEPFIDNDIVYPNGLKVKKGFLQDENSKDWDMVMFNHSFEHMDNPLQVLQKVNELLKIGGACVIRIPTASSYAWKHYKQYWVQLDAPRHFFLHTTESIKILAEQSKFEVQSINDESTAFQFIGSEQYKQGISLFSEKSYYSGYREIISDKQAQEYSKQANELNKKREGDSISIILKKIK